MQIETRADRASGPGGERISRQCPRATSDRTFPSVLCIFHKRLGFPNLGKVQLRERGLLVPLDQYLPQPDAPTYIPQASFHGLIREFFFNRFSYLPHTPNTASDTPPLLARLIPRISALRMQRPRTWRLSGFPQSWGSRAGDSNLSLHIDRPRHSEAWHSPSSTNSRMIRSL